MIQFHSHRIAKLTAELATITDQMEVEAIEWALTRHRAALRKFGVFAI